MELETLLVRLTADASQYNRVMDGAEARLSSTVRNVSDLATELATVMSGAFAGIIGTASLKIFSAFDDAINRAVIRFRGATSDMHAIAERELIAMTGKGIQAPTDLAAALLKVSTAGFSAGESLEFLATAQKVATISGIDAAQSADALTKAFLGLGLRTGSLAKDVERYNRLAEATVRVSMQTETSVTELLAAMGGRGGASIRELGLSIEDSVAYLAAFSEAGFRGTQAGQALARTLKEVRKAAIEHQNVWRDYKIDAFTATGQLKPMADIIRALEQRFRGVSDAVKSAGFSMLGLEESSQRSSGVRALMGMSQRMDELRGVAKDVTVTLDNLNERTLNSFAGQMASMKAMVEGVAEAIGRALSPAILGLRDLIRDGINYFYSFSEAQRRAILNFALLILVTNPLIMVFRILFNLVWALAVGPFIKLGQAIFWIVSQIYGLIAAIVIMGAQFVWAMAKMTASVVAFTFELGYLIIKQLVLGVVLDGVIRVIQVLDKVMQDVYDVIRNIGKILMSIGTNILNALMLFGLALLNVFLSLLILAPIIIPIIMALTAIGQGLATTWDRTKESVTDAFNSMEFDAASTWLSMREGAKSFVQDAIGFFSNFQENMKILFDWFKTNWRAIIDDLFQAMQVMWGNLTNNVTIALTGLGTIIRVFFKGLIEDIKDAFSELLRPGSGWRQEFRGFGRDVARVLAAANMDWKENKRLAEQAEFEESLGRNFPDLITKRMDLRLQIAEMREIMGKMEGIGDFPSLAEQKRFAELGSFRGMVRAQENLTAVNREIEGALKYARTEGFYTEDIEEEMKRRPKAKKEERKTELTDAIKNAFVGFKPLLEGFIPHVPGPAFNLKMAEDTRREIRTIVDLIDEMIFGIKEVAKTFVELFEMAPDALKKTAAYQVLRIMMGTPDKLPPIPMHGEVGNTFKEISLRRFALEGPGGLAREGHKGVLVHAPGMENKQDFLNKTAQGILQNTKDILNKGPMAK
jgi:TP901 family phage tail tape measure protein